MRRFLHTFIMVSLVMLGANAKLSAASRYWIASSTSTWNSTANWSTTSNGSGGASVPGASDVAFFDGVGGKNGNCTINTAVAVAGINIDGYQGTINQGTFSVTVGTSNFYMNSGTFNGGTNLFDLNRDFTLDNGTFKAPLTMTVARGWVHNGGHFNHNNGTITFDGTNATFNANPMDTFFNVTVFKSSSADNLNITSGDTMIVMNKLWCRDGDILTGYIQAHDTVLVQSTFGNMSTRLTFVGTPTSDFILNDALNSSGGVYINKTSKNGIVNVRRTISGTITEGRTTADLNIVKGILHFPQTNAVDLNYSSVNISANGTFSAPATTVFLSSNYTNNGGRFIHNNGTIEFDGTANKTFNVTTMDTFYNVNINKTASSNRNLTISSNDTLYVKNDLTLIDGNLTSNYARVDGDFRVETTKDVVTTQVIISGSSTSDVTLNEALGATLTIRKNTSSAQANFYIDGNGTIIDNGTLNLVRGTINFPLSSNVDLNYTNFTLGTGINFVAPTGLLSLTGNLYINGGTFNHNNGTVSLTGSASSIVDVQNQITFYNLILNKTGSSTNIVDIDASDTVVVLNDLTLTDGRITDGYLHLNGSVTATTTDVSSITSSIIIGGSTNTSWNLGPNTSVFNGNFELRKTSGSSMTLNSALDLNATSQNLLLTSGYIVSNTTNLLNIANDVTVSGGNNGAYISGAMRKTGNDAFIFPIGKSGFYAPIEISAPTSTTITFTAEYYATNSNSSGYSHASKDPSINNLSTREFWILNRGGSGTGNVFVTLHWSNPRSGSVNQPSSLRVCRWNGSSWATHGNGGTLTEDNNFTGTLVSSSAITSFSPFTFGSGNGNNPLPVTWHSFETVLKGNVAEVKWATSTEINNSYFEVQRSQNGLNWEVIGTQKGAGNSVVMNNYMFLDRTPLTGKSFYRIRQVDFDGKSETSDIMTIFNGGKTSENNTPVISVSPNPSNGNGINILIKAEKGKSGNMAIYGLDGKMIYQTNISADANTGFIQQRIPDGLNFINGLYILNVVLDGEVTTSKMLINR